jgi:hypothetical protein
MENIDKSIMLPVLMILVDIWWWRTVKQRKTRKWVLFQGISVCVTFGSFFLMKLTGNVLFAVICLSALICIIYFLVKAILTERNDDKPPNKKLPFIF